MCDYSLGKKEEQKEEKEKDSEEEKVYSDDDEGGDGGDEDDEDNNNSEDSDGDEKTEVKDLERAYARLAVQLKEKTQEVEKLNQTVEELKVKMCNLIFYNLVGF